MGILADQGGGHLLLVELEHDATGLFDCPWVAVVNVRGAVIEDRDGAVGLAAGVVLVSEAGALTHLEVALFAAQAPYNLATLAIDLVDGGCPAATDKQVAIVIHVYGVDVEVVDAGTNMNIRCGINVGLLEVNVVEAVPF